MQRRDFHIAITTVLTSLAEVSIAGQSSVDQLAQLPIDGPRLKVVMLAHPDMTALDLVAPQLVFATLMNTDIQLVWKSKIPVITDSALAISANATFADVPSKIDILFIPGGLKGTTAAIQDTEVIEFLRMAASGARYITSVCTGSLALAAAGLLEGYRATSHWYVRDLLKLGGAIPVNQRVVQDRNRFTGAGVTAGMDLALRISAAIRGTEYAKMQQLIFEYNPEPPFNSGSPDTADSAMTARVLQRRAAAIEAARSALISRLAK